MSLLTTPCNIILEGLANTIRQENKIKDIQIEKKEIKLSLFTDEIILYVENPNESTKYFLFKRFIYFNLFIFGCVGFSLLHAGFL